MPRTALVALTAVASLVGLWRAFLFTRSKIAAHKVTLQRKQIREQLPNDLGTWRVPGPNPEDEEQIWMPLAAIFRAEGLTPWPTVGSSIVKSPNHEFPISNGFAYMTPTRRVSISDSVFTGRLRCYNFYNALTRVVRTREGHDLMIRVLVIKDEGHDHLKILKRIAQAPTSLLTNNHALPMFSEFQFEDIIFGLFPKVGESMEAAFGYWAKNSVGDVIDMLMQALEGLAFLHKSNIAHRDAFHDNFLVQWQPESLRTMIIPVCRPRVYLIDLEVAVQVPEDCAASDRMCTGYPEGGSLTDPEMYGRPLAPEMIETDQPYCPFKLDVWQLGYSFRNFKTTIGRIDEVISDLTCSSPELRMSTDAALTRLGSVVSSMSPVSMLIEPQVLKQTI